MNIIETYMNLEALYEFASQHLPGTRLFAREDMIAASGISVGTRPNTGSAGR
jgi:hypothetical protein